VTHSSEVQQPARPNHPSWDRHSLSGRGGFGLDLNKLSRGQAHAAIAAALLRQPHAVATTGQEWDPAIAAGGRTAVIEQAA
jgi:hypothetical protein